MSLFRRKQPQPQAVLTPAPNVPAPAEPSAPSMASPPIDRAEQAPPGTSQSETIIVPPQPPVLETAPVLPTPESVTPPLPTSSPPEVPTTAGFPWPPTSSTSTVARTDLESSPADEPHPFPRPARKPEVDSEADLGEDSTEPERTPKRAPRPSPKRSEKKVRKTKATPMMHKPPKARTPVRKAAAPKPKTAMPAKRTPPASKPMVSMRPAKAGTEKHATDALPKAALEPIVAPANESTQTAFPTNLQDSRQAFVVLAWFEYLLRRIPARELPYLIDSYRKIGWIDDKLHAWFIKMAEGVGGTRTKSGEAQFARQGARGLVTIHKETLRFLNQLRAAAPRVQASENGSAPVIQARKRP